MREITSTNLKIILMLLMVLGCHSSMADNNPLAAFNLPSKVMAPEQAFQLTASHTADEVTFHWQIDNCCYLYQEYLKVFLHAPHKKPLEFNDIKLPKAESSHDPDLGETLLYRHQLEVPVSLKSSLAKETASEHWYLQVEYQGCAESRFCYPPQTMWFLVNVKDHQIQGMTPLLTPPAMLSEEIQATESTHSQATSSSEEKSSIPSGNFLIPDLGELQGFKYFTSLLSFYLLGILLTFTPCVLPMIPILATVIVGQKHINTRKAFWLSLSYVLSMAVTYAGIGIVAALIGKNLQALMQKPMIIIAFSGLFFYLGLTQLGKVHFTLFKSFKNKLHHYHIQQESGSYVGAIMMGFLATLIASPCVTAPLLGVLGYISQSGDIVFGGSALLALGLGMGTLLLLAGTLGGKFIPDTGPWMLSVNQAFAAMMFGLSIWLISRIVASGPWILGLWSAWLIYIAYCLGTFKRKSSRIGHLGIIFLLYAGILIWGAAVGENDPLKPMKQWNPWHEKKPLTLASGEVFRNIENLAALEAIQYYSLKENKPTMVVFYADWCVSCQKIEHELFSSRQIVDQLKDWTLVRANVTAYNEDSQALLKHFNLIGPPAILFFNKEGQELPQYRIVGETSAAKFLDNVGNACMKLNHHESQ